MACQIAENTPLALLRECLGLPAQCHSFRPKCIMGLNSQSRVSALGAPGAAIGYCQAIFGRAGNAATHTNHVLRLLREIDAPWANSHEMYWGHLKDEPAEQFLVGGMTPLVGNGRVPVLITGLDPAADLSAIDAILNTRPPITPGETVLVRMLLTRDDSVEATVSLLRGLVQRSLAASEMPTWWPLVQAPTTVAVLQRLKDGLGDLWQYANIAVNPFTPRDVCEVAGDQVTVAQVVVGAAQEITSEGTIRLAKGITISGAAPLASYSLAPYFERLSELESPPTLIILGPSLPSWTDEMNQERIAKLLPHLRSECSRLWHKVDPPRRETVWRMSA